MGARTHRDYVEVTRGNGKNLALEGLRGVAALTVVFSHAFWAFFPYLQSGDVADRIGNWESFLLNSPMRFSYNGTFSVAVFFVMSGYVLSTKFFQSNSSQVALSEMAVKRYIRLGIPVFAAVLICYLVIRFGFISDGKVNARDFLGGSYHMRPSLLGAFEDGLFGSLVFGNQAYNYILWTINIEFLGSIGLFGFLALFGRVRGSWMFVFFAVAILLSLGSAAGILYALMLIGAYMHRWKDPSGSVPVLAILVVLALYCGGYHWNSPAFRPMLHVAYWFIDRGFRIEWPVFFPAIGSVLLVYAVIHRNGCSNFLSHRAFVWLGDKSFSLYLLHSFVLSSLGAYTFFHVPFDDYQTRAWIAIGVTVTGSLFVSSVFARFVDEPAVRLASRFGRWAVRTPMTGSQRSTQSAPRS